MIGLKITVEDTTKNISEAVEKAGFKNFGHAAASIRKDAISSIEKSQKASEPGTPVHTRQGLAKRALLYAADKDGAVVGFAFSVAGTSMEPHEIGGIYKGEEYPQRSVMGPALERAAPRIGGDWQGSVGQ